MVSAPPVAINFIGHQGKQYGFIDNDDFARVLGIRLPASLLTGTFALIDARRSGTAQD